MYSHFKGFLPLKFPLTFLVANISSPKVLDQVFQTQRYLSLSFSVCTDVTLEGKFISLFICDFMSSFKEGKLG